MNLLEDQLDEAIRLLESGALVGIPTETVYGLAANALNPDAVLKIFEAKQRPFFDPLIVHVPSLAAAALYAEFDEKAYTLAEAIWPGPLTLILPKKALVPDLVSSGLPTVGIRVPAHPLTLELLRRLDFPLAAPSANPFGYTSPTTAAHVMQQLGDQVNMVLDGGACEVGVESTIVSIEGNVVNILRPGGTPRELFEEMGFEIHFPTSGNQILAPGTMNRHYSTRKPMILLESNATFPDAWTPEDAFLRFDRFLPEIPKHQQHLLSDSGDLRAAARNLFRLMRELDNNDSVKRIIAWKVNERGLGLAINDRLKRAAAKD